MSNHRLYYILFLFLIFVGCSPAPQYSWIQTKEGCLLWLQCSDTQSKQTYSWDGQSIGKVAHGKGTLTIDNNGKTIHTSSENLYYGTVNHQGVIEISQNEHYIGEVSSRQYNGFGVLIKGDEIFIGNFDDSNASGYCHYFKNGALKYKGLWQNHKFHGDGVLYTDNDSIVGVWNEGVLVKAKITQETKYGRFSGYTEHNLPNGEGSLYYANGWIYSGMWKDGYWDGEGILKNDSISYEGDWVKNIPQGEGILKSLNSFYDGHWENGQRNGWGDCKFSNGDYYIGDWKDNSIHGKGYYFFNSGSEYNGSWENGMQQGFGIYKTNVATYSGNWDQGFMQGEGSVEFSNGDKYIGTFNKNLFDGEGTYLFENGNIYEGLFSNNKFSELGTFYFHDGSIYEGEFENGRICGDGTYTYISEEDTVTITAQWSGNNVFPRFASICFSNGDIYEGEIINGKPTSNGVWYNEKHEKGILDKSNDLFKKYERIFNDIVIVASFAVSTVGASVPEIAPIMEIINIQINVLDIGVHVASALIDEDYISAGVEISINIALIALPAVMRKTAASATKPVVKKAAKKSIISLAKSSEQNGFKKIITVRKGSNGLYHKSLSKATTKNVKSAKKVYRDLAPKLAKTKLMKELKAIQAKGPIKLSQKELQALSDNPKDNIRAIIKAKTGDKKNFQEFFIRLAMSKEGKKQVEQLLDNPTIREYIDKSIRRSGESGAVHEWLMTKNFRDFLINPKWGNDGPYLALALNRFVQKTQKVRFRSGGGHPSSISPNSSASALFHQRLAELIDNCSSKEELFIAIKHFAKKELDRDSYKEFCKIFKEVFLTTIN